MLDFLLLISSKPIVVSLAILGAILTTFARTLGSFVALFIEFEIRELAIKRIVKVLTTSGYLAMTVSIFLFIVSGFIIDLF